MMKNSGDGRSSQASYLSAKELAEALKGRRHGGYWMAQCPVHDDARASLSISEKNGRVLLRCHAGCTQATIIDALRQRGLWPERRANGGAGPQRTIVTTYDYVDETGALLFQAVRMQPKSFFQRRPDGRGGWVNRLDGVRAVPYRLPDLLEAIAQQRPVFIVEGEKDVDALGRFGIAATTNAGGAGKWRREHATHLTGADAIIIPDNDDPGHQHAESVAKSLQGIAARVRILTLPGLRPKGDFSDWHAAGGTVEQLWALAEHVTDWHPSVGTQPPASAAQSGGLEHWHAEPWPDPVPGAELLDDLAALLCRYIVLPDHAAEAVALWTLHAWTIDAAEISPLLAVLSPTMQCGKSTLLTAIYYLTPRSVLAANISSAALFRYVEQERPTLLIDEADSFATDDEALRGILNSGHTRPTARVIRCEGQGADMKPRAFSTWAPKIVAAIGRLPGTVMDRSIIIRMRRKSRGERVERLRLRDSDDFQRLRRRALRWATDSMAALAAADADVPNDLGNRAADNWRSLAAIADLAGGPWPERARRAALALSGATDEVDRHIELLADIRRIFGEMHSDRMGAEALVTALIALPETPWAEWRHGRDPITSRGIASILKNFGIASEKTRDGRFYLKSHFSEAWSAYLPAAAP